MFGRRRSKEPSGQPAPVEVFTSLRQNVLDLDPSTVGLAPTPGRPRVWGGLMDMGYPAQRWASVVVVDDGTVSLYTSSGGGVIGAGTHPGVAAAADRWLSVLDGQLALLPVTDPPGLPAPGQVVIRALLFGGAQHSVTAAEDDLGYRRHPAYPLFHAAQELITQMRLVQEAGPGR
jgi:hypothetical protein